jgi:hypothetical protein
VETYVLLAVYLIVLPISYEAVNAAWPRPRSAYEDALNYAFHCLNAGNPFYVAGYALRAAGGSESFLARLLGSLAQFAAFHTLATIGLLWLAVRRLRRSAQRTDRGRKKTSAALPRKTRWVWGSPMVWKEMRIKGLPRNRVASSMLVILTMLVVALPVAPALFEPQQRYRIEDLNLCVRSYGTVVSILLLIAILLKGASTITIERSKQTLETLLTTPLSNAQILWGKWLGTILSVRHGVVCLAMIWTAGLLTHALHPLALLGLTLVLAVYSAACASIGLWATAVARTSMQASLAAFLIVVCLVIGQGAAFAAVQKLDAVRFGSRDLEFPAVTFTPPATIVGVAFSDREWSDMSVARQSWMRRWISRALITWSVIAVAFYWLARFLFHARRARHQFSPFRIRQKLTTS